MSITTPLCPSCRQPTEVRRFSAHDGGQLELDLCFACQGMWFDPHDNTRLSPAAVLELFGVLHAHHADAHRPVAAHLQCPRCDKGLTRGFDVALGGRYVTYRCAARHGRFSTFGSFMIEKGFVRHLTQGEVQALAERVGTIHCASCGGTVDIRNDHACPYCRSALSLLDPKAVQRAMERHGGAARYAAQGPAGGTTAHAGGEATPAALADALMALERSRVLAQREEERQRREESLPLDLIANSVELIWDMLRR